MEALAAGFGAAGFGAVAVGTFGVEALAAGAFGAAGFADGFGFGIGFGLVIAAKRAVATNIVCIVRPLLSNPINSPVIEKFTLLPTTSLRATSVTALLTVVAVATCHTFETTGILAAVALIAVKGTLNAALIRPPLANVNIASSGLVTSPIKALTPVDIPPPMTYHVAAVLAILKALPNLTLPHKVLAVFAVFPAITISPPGPSKGQRTTAARRATSTTIVPAAQAWSLATSCSVTASSIKSNIASPPFTPLLYISFK